MRLRPLPFLLCGLLVSTGASAKQSGPTLGNSAAQASTMMLIPTKSELETDMKVQKKEHPKVIRGCHCVGCHADYKWYKNVQSDKMCHYLCDQDPFCVVALRNTDTSDCWLYWHGAQSMTETVADKPFTCIARFGGCVNNPECQPDPRIRKVVARRVAEMEEAVKQGISDPMRMGPDVSMFSSWRTRANMTRKPRYLVPGTEADGSRTLQDKDFNNEVKKELVKVLIKAGVVESENSPEVKDLTAEQVARLMVKAKLDPVKVADNDPVVAAIIELAPKISQFDSKAAKFLLSARQFADASSKELNHILRVAARAKIHAPPPSLPDAVNCKLSNWGDWSQCSEKCAGGYREQTRKVLVEADNGGEACGQLAQRESCNLQPCAANCLLGKWSGWGTCSKTCGGGTMRRSRAVSSKRCGHSVEARKCSTQPCPSDCVVSAWSKWSNCSSPCAGGARTRQRTVVRKATYDGKRCPTLKQETQCNTFPCPINCAVGGWTAWSSCNQPCGEGRVTRKRPVLKETAYGGKLCPDLTQAKNCTQKACSLDCVVASWQEWGKCDKECGGGLKKRSRVVQKPSSSSNVLCPHQKDVVPCNLQPCAQNCKVSKWSEWGKCNKPCGAGEQLRIRLITAKEKNGGQKCPKLKQSQLCNTQACATDCLMTDWTSWSFCTEGCGGGVQSRTRSINMYGKDGGKRCPKDEASFLAVRPCNAEPCNPSCSPSAWGEWGGCTKSCGGGIKTHTRTIQKPENFSIDVCPSGKEHVPCNINSCPVHCQVSDWMEWGECSEPCAGGVQQRRKNTIVAPAYGGDECPPIVQDRQCNAQTCPIDCVVGDWSKFGSCSTSCGDGVRKRYRKFEAPLYKGKACPHSEEKEICRMSPCPRDCELSAWADWKKCSQQCGGGETYRDRRILLKEEYGGAPCVRANQKLSLMQNKTCNNQLCPVECKLAAWSNWGGCSSSCGKGVAARTRTVLQAALNNADPCPSSRELRACKLADCPVDCSVTPWSSWSQCSAKCQGGTQQMIRKVIKGESMGGQGCPSVLRERGCNQDVPCPKNCGIHAWADWTPCSAPCGSGIRSRSRRLVAPIGGGSKCPHAFEKELCNPQLCPFKLQLISLNKPTNQSSKFEDGAAARAVDGDTDGLWNRHSCTRTLDQVDPWWKVDLRSDHYIQKVIVWNRVDCCKERLHKFTVKTCCPWETCGAAVGDESVSTTVQCHFVKARYVQILLEGKAILTLCEVQVFGSVSPPPFSTLVSVGKPASQSSEEFEAAARRAVDGKTSGTFSTGTCTHTEKQADPWWKVDLMDEYHIDKVIVWNRVDCCQDLLKGFEVKLCCPWKKCARESHLQRENVATCHHEKGRYVRVDVKGTAQLAMCEVQVYGAKVGALPQIQLLSNGKPASQVSEVGGAGPTRAIDGNTNGKFSSGSCTQTKTGAKAWWKTDLQKVYRIAKVVVWNRSDCCQSKLNGFVVKLCCPWKQCGTGGDSLRNEVQCFDQEGRYVQVELPSIGSLTLCEVQVYGAEVA